MSIEVGSKLQGRLQESQILERLLNSKKGKQA